jgi:hypothetical protein
MDEMNDEEYSWTPDEREEYQCWLKEMELASDEYKNYCYEVGRFAMEFERLMSELKSFLGIWWEKEKLKTPSLEKPSFVEPTGGKVLGIFLNFLNRKPSILDDLGKQVLTELYDRISSLNETRKTVIHSEHMDPHDMTYKILFNKVYVGKEGKSDIEISIASTKDLGHLGFYMTQATTAIRNMKSGFGKSRQMQKTLENHIKDFPLKLVSTMQQDLLQESISTRQEPPAEPEEIGS